MDGIENQAFQRVGKWSLLLFLLCAVAFLFLHLFILPFYPVVAWGDQCLFLLEARHSLEGMVIYRDFFEFNTPGTTTLYYALFKLFGVRAWIPDVMLLVLGVGLASLSILIARKVITGPSAYLPALLFLTFPFRTMLDGTHHWYSTLAAIAALAVLLEGRSLRRLAAAGILLGVATWFTSARGPAALAGVITFLWWESRQTGEDRRELIHRLATPITTFVVTTIVLNGYYVWRAGLKRFLYCTVVYPLKYYPAEPANNWRTYSKYLPHIHPWSRTLEVPIWGFIHLLVPLVYVLFFVRNWREGSAIQHRDRLMLINLVGFFLFLGVAPSPGVYRLCSVSLPALILLVWFVRCPGRLERLTLRALWVAGLTLLIVEPVMRQRHWRAILDLPTGRTAYLDQNSYDAFRWVHDHARASDYLFGDQLMCFAMGLGDPGQVPYVTATEYTRPEQIQGLLGALEKHRVRFVRWYAALDAPDIPGSRSNLGPLRAYLLSHYHRVITFGSGEKILERDGY